MNRELYAPVESRRIDYALMNKEYPKLKAALTRAQNGGDPVAVVKACERFVDLSREVGCMPDDWSRWRNALEDSYNTFKRSEAGDEDWYENDGVIAKRFQAVARHFDY